MKFLKVVGKALWAVARRPEVRAAVVGWLEDALAKKLEDRRAAR